MPTTAADLPTELFPLILDNLCRDDFGEEEEKRDVWVRDMTSCSLVCLYWANRCRCYLCRRHKLVIKSLMEFLTLEAYAVNGCTHLVPLYSVISRLDVDVYLEQTWQSVAWFYRTNKSRFLQPQATYLVLRGPVPASAHKISSWTYTTIAENKSLRRKRSFSSW